MSTKPNRKPANQPLNVQIGKAAADAEFRRKDRQAVIERRNAAAPTEPKPVEEDWGIEDLTG